MIKKPKNIPASVNLAPMEIPLNDNPDLVPHAIPEISYDLRVLQSLRRIIHSVDLHSRKLFMQHNITGPQLACLLTVSEHDQLTTSSLARKVHLSPSTIVGILDRLEQKALVVRHRSRQDRRVVSINITPAGRELADSAPSPLQEALFNSLGSLPEIEQASITLSLEKIAALMEAGPLEVVPPLATGTLAGDQSEKNSKY